MSEVYAIVVDDDDKGPKDLRKEFERFDAANPNVYALFKEFTFQAIAAGAKRFSAAAVFERLRWETMIKTQGAEPFKVRDAYRAFYSRKFMAEYPQYDGFFRTTKGRWHRDGEENPVPDHQHREYAVNADPQLPTQLDLLMAVAMSDMGEIARTLMSYCELERVDAKTLYLRLDPAFERLRGHWTEESARRGLAEALGVPDLRLVIRVG
jgi:hypothetical protein